MKKAEIVAFCFCGLCICIAFKMFVYEGINFASAYMLNGDRIFAVLQLFVYIVVAPIWGFIGGVIHYLRKKLDIKN